MAAKKKGSATPTKKSEIQAAETAVVVEKVSKLKSPGVVQAFTDLKLKVHAEIDKLSASVSEGIRTLEEVGSAIEAQQNRLQELYAIEKEALTLDEVRGLRLAEEARFEAYQADLEIRREREEEEYQYNLSRDRQAEIDAYDDTVRTRDRVDAEKAEKKARALAEREAAVAAQEAELASLRSLVEAHPVAIEAAVKKAEAILGNVLKRDYEHKTQIALKDFEAAHKVANQEIVALRDRLGSCQATIDSLNSALDRARAEVREIAAKAVESASGQQALAALQASQAGQAMATSKGR